MPVVKKAVWLILNGLAVLLAADILLIASSCVPISNQIYRMTAGAPTVHVREHLLMYQARTQESAEFLEPYGMSDEGLPLFKVKGTPATPPFLFLHDSGVRYHKYKFAKPPWSM